MKTTEAEVQRASGCRVVLRAVMTGILTLLIGAGAVRPAGAHPLGNFTISHFSGLTVVPGELRLHYALDLAEIPTVQERQKMDTNSDGKISPAEKDAYLREAKRRLPAGLSLRVNGSRTPLRVRAAELAFLPGAGNLPTLKLHLQMVAPLPAKGGRLTLEYADTNYQERTGWKEMVITAATGARIIETTAPAAGLSNALASYPTDLISAPPQQTNARAVVWFGATARTADVPSNKRFANRLTELLTTGQWSWSILLFSLLVAFSLGALHALEPGHGKTVIGAYLVGSRGSARHAVLLGLTVTASHTIGVFALGLIVLYASRWIVPERLYPWLGCVSGLAITIIGLALLTSRLKGPADHQHAPGLLHRHVPADRQGRSRTPNAQPLTPLSLLLLGISGGIVPCPSALVVLLSSIALHRVMWGLLLILAFSAGLAAVLVGIGLLMVTGGRLMEAVTRSDGGSGEETRPWEGRLLRGLPAVSAAVVCVLGIVVAVQSLAAGGMAPRVVISAATTVPLLFGFALGMKHALETDHLVAVSTIVSEQGSLVRSALVGTFWGLGHTSSLFLAALLVIVLRVRIPERVAMGLEFTVALMLIALGLQAVRGWLTHRGAPTALPAGTAVPMSRVGRRPYLVGLVHGMAGSAALMLLVLTTIPGPWMALLYVLLFGFGSVGGMLLMSVLLSLPLRFTARRLGGMVGHVRLAAGLASAAFGLFLAWQIGYVEGLFR